METVVYAIISVVLVSLASMCGIVLSWMSRKVFDRLLFVLVSFAVGTMLGTVLFDLLPEAYEGIASIANVGWIFLWALVFSSCWRIFIFTIRTKGTRTVAGGI